MVKGPNPFQEIGQFFEQMSKQFDTAAQNLEMGESFGSFRLGTASPPVDIVETDEAFIARIDLPGFERDEIDVKVIDDTLRLRAHTESKAKEEGERYIRQERQVRSVDRQFRIPEPVNDEEIRAKMNNGVLEITMPKQIQESGEKIEIHVE